MIRVLILDDNPADCEMLRTNLESIDKNKYEIVIAKDEKSAWRLLEAQEFDVCLLDYHLSSMTAEKFLENVEYSYAPAFIILSRQPDNKIKERLKNYNVYECLAKEEITNRLLDCCIQYVIQNKKTTTYLNELNSVIKKSSLEHQQSLVH